MGITTTKTITTPMTTTTITTTTITTTKAVTCKFHSTAEEGIFHGGHCHHHNFNPGCNAANVGKVYYTNKWDAGGGDAKKLGHCASGWLWPQYPKPYQTKYTCACEAPTPQPTTTITITTTKTITTPTTTSTITTTTIATTKTITTTKAVTCKFHSTAEEGIFHGGHCHHHNFNRVCNA